jgi:phospholipid/cholesterol/gamma-HCH transport system substrate-binding protein
MPRRRNIQLQVGIFVTFALVLLGLVILVLGNQRSMFASKVRLHTSFPDVNGLIVGAPVRLAGVDVGRVTQIRFSDDLERPYAILELAIETEYMPRVRRDTRALIDSKGLLGDKIINLTVGSPRMPELKEGDAIEAGESGSLERLAHRVEDTAGAIGEAADAAKGAVTSIASPEVTENVRRITASLADLLEQAQRGDGLWHALVADPALARRVASIVTQLDSASTHARSASERLDSVMAQVEHGPGTLNTLLYGPEGKALLADLGELGKRLNRLAANVERGNGTIGGLLVDPSVYEDMKTVLGNIERNVLFKALVRMTIKEGDIQRPALVPRPAPPLRDTGD